MLTQAEIDALLTGSLEAEEPGGGQNRVNLADLMGQEVGAPGPAGQVKTDGTVDAIGSLRGKAKAKEVRPYNFWSPDHFSKDQMRAVELVHEDLADRLANSLPSFLHTNLRPRVVHSEQGRFHDFLKDLPTISLFHIISLSPLPGQMVITISPDISYLVLEQRLGGVSHQVNKGRQLTDIDQTLLRSLVDHILGDIKTSWSRVVAVEPNLEDSTTNQLWVQMMVGNERVMLLTFELAFQNMAGTMNIYIPFSMLKPIATVLNPHAWFSGHKERSTLAESRQTALEALKRIDLTVRVFLGSAEVSFRDLSNLKPGDVLILDTTTRQDLTVNVAEREVFKARVGKVGNHLAAQITAVKNTAR